MPVGFVITSGSVDISGLVWPGVRIVRGMDVGESQLTPRASTCSMVIDDVMNVVVGSELIVREPNGAAMFTGTVRDVSPGRDRNNVRNYYIQADGPITDIVSAGSGFESDNELAVGLSDALGRLLEAGGVTDRDIGASARELALFYIDEDVPLWRQVLALVRTAGPRARLFELGDGRLRFRDVAAPPVSRTIRGRLSGLTAGGLVSAVPNDDVGRERVVNSVMLGTYEGAATGLVRVADVQAGWELIGNRPGRVRATATVAQFTSADVEGGDTLLVFTLLATVVGALQVYNIPSGLNTIYDEQPSARKRIAIGYASWPQQDLVAEARNDETFTVRALANLTALVLRGGGTPALLTTGAAVEPGTLMVAMCDAVTTGSENSATPPAGWDLVPGAMLQAGVGVTAASDGRRTLFVATRIAGDGDTAIAGDWTIHQGGIFGDVMRPTVAIVGVTIDRAIIWTDQQSGRTLAPNETIFVSAGADAPFTDVVPPAAGTDFTVDVGSITSVWLATLRTPTSVTILLTAGASGATISGLQLRGSPLTRDVVSNITAKDAASIAKWGSRQPRLANWPYIDLANAQALADEIVSYGAQPRRSWSARLDADRDADTLAAVYETELGDVLTCNIDSDLNQDGEVVRLEYLIGESGTLVAYMTFLATVAGLPVPITATAPGKPFPPVLTSSAPSFAALWMAPDDGGSPITFYTFRYREQGTAMWIESSVGGLSTNIFNLKTNTTYEAQVRATNGVGDGPYSDSGLVTTAALAGLLLTTGGHLLLTTGGSLELVG